MKTNKQSKVTIWTASTLIIIVVYLLFLVYPIVTILSQALFKDGHFSLEQFSTFFSKTYYFSTCKNNQINSVKLTKELISTLTEPKTFDIKENQKFNSLN